MKAVRSRNTDIVERLVARGAKVSAVDKVRFTCFVFPMRLDNKHFNCKNQLEFRVMLRTNFVANMKPGSIHKLFCGDSAHKALFSPCPF